MPLSDGDIFNVTLRGATVPCRSLNDAVDVKTAEDIIAGNDLTHYQPEELERLAAVVTRYKKSVAAAALLDKAKLLRGV